MHLVEDQQHAVAVAPFAQRAQPAVWRNDHAGLALDRLHQHRADVVAGNRFERREIAEVEQPEPVVERAEVGARRRVGREAHDRRRAAVEVVACGKNRCVPGRDAFDPVAPASRRLDRGLDRLGAGVHRQCALEARNAAQLLEEGAEPIVVERPRRDAHARKLRLRRRHQPRMAMPVSDRRISAHEVEIAVSVGVEQPDVLATLDDDRQRVVVVRADRALALEGADRGRLDRVYGVVHPSSPHRFPAMPAPCNDDGRARLQPRRFARVPDAVSAVRTGSGRRSGSASGGRTWRLRRVRTGPAWAAAQPPPPIRSASDHGGHVHVTREHSVDREVAPPAADVALERRAAFVARLGDHAGERRAEHVLPQEVPGGR